MSKALLINPGQERGPYRHTSHRRVHRDPPPLSILYVGSQLQEMGCEIDLYDAHVE